VVLKADWGISLARLSYPMIASASRQGRARGGGTDEAPLRKEGERGGEEGMLEFDRPLRLNVLLGLGRAQMKRSNLPSRCLAARMLDKVVPRD
jgi:hypothetical protein